MQKERGFFHGRVRKTIAGLCLLLAVSIVCSTTDPLPDTTAFLLLICILAIATLGDMLVAILLSLVADAAYSWFLPPANSFAIEGPAAFIALATFLATAVIGSQLSVRAQRRAREAEDRNQEMERIHALGRALLAHDTLSATGEAAVWQIVAALEASGAALYIGKLQRTHTAGTIPDIDCTLRQVFTTGETSTCSTPGSPRLCVYPLTSGDHRIGALAIQSDDISEMAAQLTLNLISVALERAVATERAVEASAISRNEELRRAMVDAFAHNLKTPLTSIKACTSALLRRSSTVTEDTRELLTVVDEETDRLTRLIADSLELVRVGEKVAPAREFIPVSQPILAALADLRQSAEGRQIKTGLPEASLSIAADPHLIQIVVSQLLDNALKYSPPDSPIEIKASLAGNHAVIAVRNEGPAIDEDERGRIFDKFYRGRENRGRIEGTGMGLAIARTIVESHGGEIEARNDADGCIVFEFSLPLAPDTVLENVNI